MTKSEKLAIELSKAIAKRDQWEQRVQRLQTQYTDEQNTEILGMVRQAQLTPEQLAQVIAYARKGIFDQIPDGTEIEGPFDEIEEDIPAREVDITDGDEDIPDVEGDILDREEENTDED